MSRVCLKWARDGLAVANARRTFTVGGLEVLCSSHRSDNATGEPRAFASTGEAMRKVLELRGTRLEANRQCPGNIVEHAQAEKEMGLDHTNRLLLELLQNADDAAALNPIDYKGLGFKSVLEINDRVRIQSGHLRVRLDRGDSRQAVLKADLPVQDEVPFLRLPFWDEQDRWFPEIEGTYDTTILLSGKPADGRQGQTTRR